MASNGDGDAAARADDAAPPSPLDDPVAAAAAMAGVDPAIARALLREDHEAVDPALPEIIAALKRRGAAECWHKHSSFLEHLLGTHRIAALWGLPREVALCALLHSAYSNSFVNLALFSPDDEGREAVRRLAGEEVERWTWLFCRVPRHELIYHRLVDPIVYGRGGGGGGKGGGGGSSKGNFEDRPSSPAPAAAKRAKTDDEGDNEGGKAATSSAPAPDYSASFPASVTVADIRDSSPIALDAYEVGTLVALTILDFSDQWFSWQDGMFATEEDGGGIGGGGGAAVGGRMRYAGKRAHCLWPGEAKPGLYLHTLSEMGRLVVAANARLESLGDARRVPLPRPWSRCSYVVPRAAQREGRDLYWRAVTELSGAGAAEFADREQEDFWGRGQQEESNEEEEQAERWARGEAREREAEEALRACARVLPCVGEPRIVLSQLLLQRATRLSFEAEGGGGGGGDPQQQRQAAVEACWREAGELAVQGLSLMLGWGTPWDKRFSWAVWCAWARVCAEGARKREWPRNGEPLRVINLGLVR